VRAVRINRRSFREDADRPVNNARNELTDVIL
jgi:hypothetical protein